MAKKKDERNMAEKAQGIANADKLKDEQIINRLPKKTDNETTQNRIAGSEKVRKEKAKKTEEFFGK